MCPTTRTCRQGPGRGGGGGACFVSSPDAALALTCNDVRLMHASCFPTSSRAMGGGARSSLGPTWAASLATPGKRQQGLVCWHAVQACCALPDRLQPNCCSSGFPGTLLPQAVRINRHHGTGRQLRPRGSGAPASAGWCLHPHGAFAMVRCLSATGRMVNCEQAHVLLGEDGSTLRQLLTRSVAVCVVAQGASDNLALGRSTFAEELG